MQPPNLSTNEARIIGCLMEKSIVTPDQYPLTLNALTNACNQKSSRNPVMSLTQGAVLHTIRDLETKHLVRVEENFKRGVEKFTHRFCNTRYSELHFDSAQFAIVCLLLLRGAQTPGELRSRSGRLHDFADNAEVVTTLTDLLEWEGDPFIIKLPRTAGRKDSEYMHLLSGPVDIQEYESETLAAKASVSAERATVSELTERVKILEQEIAELKKHCQFPS